MNFKMSKKQKIMDILKLLSIPAVITSIIIAAPMYLTFIADTAEVAHGTVTLDQPYMKYLYTKFVMQDMLADITNVTLPDTYMGDETCVFSSRKDLYTFLQ